MDLSSTEVSSVKWIEMNRKLIILSDCFINFKSNFKLSFMHKGRRHMIIIVADVCFTSLLLVLLLDHRLIHRLMELNHCVLLLVGWPLVGDTLPMALCSFCRCSCLDM